MLHLFKSAAARAITYGLAGLLVVGLLVALLRLALPFADLLRSDLEGVLSRSLGLEVRVGRLGLHLAGMTPQIVLKDASLLDLQSGRPQLSLEQLRVDLNLAASLRELAPQIDSLTLVGAKLLINRLEDGSITVAGLEGMERGDPEAMRFFLGNGRFRLEDSDIYWDDKKSETPRLQLSNVRVRFENIGERHRIGILARPFDDPSSQLRLVANLRGKPGSPAAWNGELYLHWRGKNLDRILEGRLATDLHLASDSLQIESWNHLEGMIVTRSLNRIATNGLRLWSDSGGERTDELRFDRLGGLLRWRSVGNGWRLEVKNLELIRRGTRRPVSDLAIGFSSDDKGSWTIEGGSQFLDLEDASDLLARSPRLPPEILDRLGEMRPRGELHDPRFRFVSRAGASPLWAVSGRIEDLSLEAQGDLPGIQGFGTEVAANEHGGRLDLAGGDLILDFPRLFPNPIRLEETAGDIHWRRDVDGAFQIGAREIAAANTHIATRSRFTVYLPAHGGSPILDLQTDFRDADIASVRHYIPSRRLKEKLARWLDRAFVCGRVPSGTLLFRGAPADFPFEHQEGRFQVLFGIEDGILDFNEEWPRLEEIVAEVRFLNSEMEISADEARFLDSRVGETTARIPDLRKAVAVEIQGSVEGPFADGLRVLGETPLREKLGVLASAFQATGVSRLDLDMSIPLRHKGHKGPFRLSGELSWPGPAALTLASLDVELADLAGKLHFTESSLEAKSIEAVLWDVPVSLQVDTLAPRGDGDPTTRVRSRGRFPTSVLAQQFPSAIWETLKGQADLALHLDISGTGMGEKVPPIDYRLESDLVGVAVELPDPLGKSASEARRLELSGRLIQEEPLRSQGRYGDLGINLELDHGADDKLGLARASFNLGGASVPLPKTGEVHLRGSIATLELQPWLDWRARREVPSSGQQDGRTALSSVDLSLGQLLLNDIALNDVRFVLERQRDRWDASIKARELEGNATIPHHPRREPVRIAMERLDLKGMLVHEGREHREVAGGRHTDPRQAHTLDLSIERLLWGDNPIGRVTLRSRAAPDGLELTEVALAGPLMSIQGTGSWLQMDAGPVSRLAVTAKGSDLGEFLRSLGFNSLFYKAPGTIDLALDWPGDPVQFSAAGLDGRIRFEVGAGSLLEVEPGMGRMLGILNLDALQRRLSLDFSDLFGRGYAFEKISGQLDIEQGTATIEEFVIEGPSADISVAGTTDLVAQEFDQIVTVTPSIGTGVAIASAVAGGPLVGAAVFLADQVSGGAVDKLGRHQYVLSGPWTKPVIRRGQLGADRNQEAATGHFLKEPGSAAASRPTEPKPAQSRAATTAEATVESESAPPSSRGERDRNLCLGED
ncbi:MAG: TIGR02099 family protein [Chromatiaceae bacterium]|nr:TIGR02099 family protein [Chromatiaceae bacterium]